MPKALWHLSHPLPCAFQKKRELLAESQITLRKPHQERSPSSSAMALADKITDPATKTRSKTGSPPARFLRKSFKS